MYGSSPIERAGRAYNNLCISRKTVLVVSKISTGIDTYRKILKKSGEYFVQIFRHSKRKFHDSFMLIFGKTCEKLSEKT